MHRALPSVGQSERFQQHVDARSPELWVRHCPRSLLAGEPPHTAHTPAQLGHCKHPKSSAVRPSQYTVLPQPKPFTNTEQTTSATGEVLNTLENTTAAPQHHIQSSSMWYCLCLRAHALDKLLSRRSHWALAFLQRVAALPDWKAERCQLWWSARARAECPTPHGTGYNATHRHCSKQGSRQHTNNLPRGQVANCDLFHDQEQVLQCSNQLVSTTPQTVMWNWVEGRQKSAERRRSEDCLPFFGQSHPCAPIMEHTAEQR